jgi:hypothetical protein
MASSTCIRRCALVLLAWMLSEIVGPGILGTAALANCEAQVQPAKWCGGGQIP